MSKYDENDGVWRTVGGRRIFIKNGQSLSDAMKESGKFKKASRRKPTRKEKEAEYEEYKKAKENGNLKDNENWEELEEKYGERYLDETDPKISITGEDGNRKTVRKSEFQAEAQKRFDENQEKIKEMTDKVLTPKEIKSLQHEARKERQEAERTTGKDSEEHWKKFDDLNERLGKDRIDQTLDQQMEAYKKETSKVKVDKNDLETLRKIADSGEDINKYDGLDDIAKDYINNRRKEISQNKRNEEFQKATNDTVNKSIENDPRKAVDYYMKKGDFEKADEIMADYGLEDERDEFIGGQNNRVQADYKEHRKTTTSEKENSRKQIEKDFPYTFSEEAENTAHRINLGGYDDIDDVIDDFAMDQGLTRDEAKYALLKDEFKTRQELYMEARNRNDYSDAEKNHLEAMAKDSYFRLQEAQENLKDFYEADKKASKEKNNNDWVREAFNKYRKEHPKSKLTINDFMKKK